MGTATGFQLQINVCHIGIARAQRICNAYKRFIVVNVFLILGIGHEHVCGFALVGNNDWFGLRRFLCLADVLLELLIGLTVITMIAPYTAIYLQE